MDSSRYDLLYAWREPRVNIPEVIRCTHQRYGDDGVSDKDFDRMISVITKGGSGSVLSRRCDPTIISEICKLFPNKLNTKIVDKIIKCLLGTTKYPRTCVQEILNTGYELTRSQTQKLNAMGYMMVDFLDNMSYDEFISIFDSAEFILKFKEGFDDEKSVTNGILDDRVQQVRDICTKYGITLQSNFIKIIFDKIKYYNNNIGIISIINVHIFAKELGIKVTEETFTSIIDEHRISFLTNENRDETNEYKLKMMLKFVSFYERSYINRDLILKNIHREYVFEYLLHPLLTSYDPMEDIMYIFLKVNQNDRCMYFLHMLKYNYLIYDDFLLYLLSLGLENKCFILSKYLELKGMSIPQKYVRNFFTFGSPDTIALLSECKIIPTLNQILYCSDIDQLSNIKKTSIFMDDEILDYINTVSESISHEESCRCEIIKELEDRIDIYDSLSEEYKHIVERFGIEGTIRKELIFRYNIKLTKKIIKYMIRNNMWTDIILLIHLSDRYEYIIHMIDIDMIITAPTYLARIWLLNNIVRSNNKRFVITNKFVDVRPHYEEDIMNISKERIIYDIRKEKETLNRSKQENQKLLIDDKF